MVFFGTHAPAVSLEDLWSLCWNNDWQIPYCPKTRADSSQLPASFDFRVLGGAVIKEWEFVIIEGFESQLGAV